MLRHGGFLLTFGIAGFIALAIYNVYVQRAWRPLSVPLKVTASEMITPRFTVEPGQLYEISVSADLSRAAPYTDCWLGTPPGQGGLYGDCKGHPSLMNLLWAVRNDRRGVLASGEYPRETINIGWTGNRVDATIAEFSVPRRMRAFVELHYQRNPAVLGVLHPYIAVFAPAPFHAAFSAQIMIILFLTAFGGLGTVMLVFGLAAQSLPARRATP
jgi:ABC-type antimicrobial peptide transport system permease subunit